MPTKYSILVYRMILYRRKILLHLLSALGGECSATDFQKYLFLLSHEQKSPSYDFIPHRFGCFSMQSYADRRSLLEANYLIDDERWILSKKIEGNPETLIKQCDRSAISQLIQKHGKLKGKALVRTVYKQYPFFAIRSEIAARILSTDELRPVKDLIPRQKQKAIFSIGYEGQSIDSYICKLIENNISLLCDVRKNPLSRKYGFSKNELRRLLESVGIKYRHIPELGIDSSERQELNTFDDYQRLFKRYESKTLSKSRKHLEEIFELMDSHGRVAMTCFEADVKCCHRGRIATALEKLSKHSINVEHL